MSFEVTVTPTVYNVEVEVNPSVQPFDVQVITQQDLADLVDEAKQYAEDAEDSADSASASASSASASASASASSANSASASASSASASANTATTQAGIATTQAGIATTQAGIATTKAQEASQSASDALASEQASAQSASDALQSEQNALASEQASALSEANALASEQSASASASTATAQAGIATTQAGIATTQAGNALTSANNALNSANDAAASAASASAVGTSTLLTGFATGSNTTILGTDTILGAFQKAQGQINARVSGTGVAGLVSFWTGTGTQSGDSGLTWDNTNKFLTNTGYEIVSAISNINLGTSPLNVGPILTFTLTDGGSGYVDGFYTNVTLPTLASATLAVFDVTVIGGIVTDLVLKYPGSRYVVNGTYTTSSISLGGTGSGLIITVNSVRGSNIYLTNSFGSSVRLENSNAGILTNEVLGQMLFASRDATSFANGDRVIISAKAAGTAGGGFLDFDTSNISSSEFVRTLRLRHDSARFLGGTAVIPAISFLTDTNTGIFSAGADLLAFSTGGSERGRFATTGNFLINTTTDAGFRLDVNGTARVQGALTTNLTAGRVPFIGTGGVLSSSANLLWDDSISRLEVSALQGIIRITGGTSSAIGQKSASLEFFSTDVSVQSGSTGARVRAEIATVYDNAGGGASSLVFYTQNGSTDPVVERWRIGMAGILESIGSQTIRTSTGDLTIATNSGNGNIVLNPQGSGTVSITDAKNISLGTTTGTRIGTATNQLLSLWNATPNVQPTTAITAGAFVANTSGIANDTATFDGYTMGQVVAALRRIGALA
jgi:hypothetical protein